MHECVIFSVLIRAMIAVIKNHEQKLLVNKGFASLICFHITVHHHRKLRQELKQGKNLETEANAEAMECCCLLAYSP